MSTPQLKNQQRKDLVPEKRYHPSFTKEIPMKKLIAMQILVKKETMATGGDPPPCPGPSLDVSSHQREGNVHINWCSLGTVSERSNEVLQISCIDKGTIQEQTKDQQSYIYSISSKHSRKQLHCDNSDSECSKVTYDEWYANNHNIEYSNSCFGQEGDSDEYFDVSYDKQKKMSCIVLPNLDA